MGVIGGLVAFIVGGGLTAGPSWSERARLLALCLVYGHCIALASLYVLPPWWKRFAGQNRVSWWMARALALPVVCAVGGLLAVAILIPLGLIREEASLLALVFPYLRWGPAPFVIATFFFSVTGYEYLRERLETTALALKTAERDEAEARRLAVEAQFASLESRVHPHFLFNTLNSVAALIPSDPAGAERMVGQLASLLRASLDAAPSALVPLEQELRVVRDYLAIEHVRFGERLRYRFDIDSTLADCMVPRMSLQTLVENSVKYAVGPSPDGSTILVRAARDADGVRIQVCDDGPGFDADHAPEGHGLALLRDRLAGIVGGGSQVTVDSRPGHTTVTMLIAHA